MTVEAMTKLIGHRVRLVTTHGSLIVGRVIATCASPTVEIEQEDGRRVTYATHRIHEALDDTCTRCGGSGVVGPAKRVAS